MVFVYAFLNISYVFGRRCGLVKCYKILRKLFVGDQTNKGFMFTLFSPANNTTSQFSGELNADFCRHILVLKALDRAKTETFLKTITKML